MRAVLTLRRAVPGVAVCSRAGVNGVTRVVGVGVASVLSEVVFAGEIAGEPAGRTPTSAQPEVASKRTGTSTAISKWEPNGTLQYCSFLPEKTTSRTLLLAVTRAIDNAYSI